MDSTDGAVELEVRQTRLSRFGRVLACVGLGYAGLLTCVSLWLGQLSIPRASVPLFVAAAAFGAMWLLLRGPPRSARFVRDVEHIHRTASAGRCWRGSMGCCARTASRRSTSRSAR